MYVCLYVVALCSCVTQACILFLLGLAALVIVCATPLYYIGMRDYETPVYNYTYVHCDKALQYDVRYLSLRFGSHVESCLVCHTIANSHPASGYSVEIVCFCACLGIPVDPSPQFTDSLSLSSLPACCFCNVCLLGSCRCGGTLQTCVAMRSLQEDIWWFAGFDADAMNADL